MMANRKPGAFLEPQAWPDYLAPTIWGELMLPGQTAIAAQRAAPSGLMAKLAQTWPARMAKDAWQAVKLPGDVYQGNVPITGEDGRTNPEVINRAADLAGILMGGTYATAPAGAVGAGPVKPIRAYHGSPHDFDRFDISKIGTGEGAQAYGYGLYFAEREGVARGYRDNLSPSGFKIGEADKPITSQNLTEWGFNDLAQNEILSALRNYGGNYSATIAEFNRRMPNLRPHSPQWNAIQDAAAFLKGAAGKEVKPASAGRMYEVDIHAPPERFLDWDKPLAEQAGVIDALRGSRSKHIREIVNDPGILALERNVYGTDIGPMRGEDLFKRAAIASTGKVTGGPQTSAIFNKAGIPGIKYLDAGSRTAGAGSRNYVVFDDSIVEILKKYGLAGLGIGLGGTATLGSNQPAPVLGFH